MAPLLLTPLMLGVEGDSKRRKDGAVVEEIVTIIIKVEKVIPTTPS